MGSNEGSAVITEDLWSHLLNFFGMTALEVFGVRSLNARLAPSADEFRLIGDASAD